MMNECSSKLDFKTDGHVQNSKELGPASNTIRNEIKRGTVTQIIQGKVQDVYLADAGNRVYKQNRKNSQKWFKRLECSGFIKFVIDKFFNDHWSLYACFGYALNSALFERSEIICTKTHYNYVARKLIAIKNTDLPEKLKRNTKRKYIIRSNKTTLVLQCKIEFHLINCSSQ